MAYQQRPPVPHQSQSTIGRNKLHRLFQSVDEDHSGSINATELQKALSNGLNTPFNPETIRLIMGIFDRDNSSEIDFDKFADLWKYIDDWLKCFRSFDRDNSRSIDMNELKQALTTFGYRLSNNFYGLLVRTFDRTGRGAIAFDDFIHTCLSIQTMTQSFQKYDHTQTGKITIEYEDFLTMVFSNKI